MKNVMKKIGILGLSAAMAAAMMLPVFAADDSNNTGDSSSSDDAKVAETIQNDYWADLTACTIDGQNVAAPSDLPTTMVNEPFNQDLDSVSYQLHANGIDENPNAMDTWRSAWWDSVTITDDQGNTHNFGYDAGYSKERQYFQAVTKGIAPQGANDQLKQAVNDLNKAYLELDPEAGK